MSSISLLSFIVLFSCLICCYGEGDGSPHFQIDHKSGKLDILATRTSADIQSKEDNVDLVMKPGESFTSSFSHEIHHEDVSHQRHDMPHEEEASSKFTTKEDSDAKTQEKEASDTLNNFDGKWVNLFKFPKVNRTVDSNIRHNVTSKNETEEQIEERETAKMIELQNEADGLAKLVEESSKRKIDPNEVKDAAAKLERKAEALQTDIIYNFVNRSGSDKNRKETEKTRENGERSSDKTEDKGDGNDKTDKEIKKLNGKDGKDRVDGGKGNCPDCGAKIPKPGGKTNDPVAPRLSKGDNETAIDNEANKTKTTNDFTDTKVNGTKTLKTSDNRVLKLGYKGYFKKEDGKPKAEKGSLEGSSKGKKIKANTKEEQKNGKECSDCGTKVPKPGKGSDSGELIVPKLTGNNETEDKNSFSEGQEEKTNGVKNVKNINGKENEADSLGKNGNRTNSKSGKGCKNCQGNIPKPGEKEDGKLVVPKLTKGNETEKKLRQSEFKNVNVKTAKSEENESFDLDNDAQEITEDMNYVDLSPSMAEKGEGIAGNYKENESKSQSQFHESHFQQGQELENKTVSRESNTRYNSPLEEKQKSSNDGFGTTRKIDGENEGENRSANSNETMKADTNQKEKAEENSNINNGLKEESLSAGRAETEKEGNEAAEGMKNEGKKSTDDNNKNRIENKKLGEDEKTNKDKEAETMRKVTTKSDKGGKYKSLKSMKEKFDAANDTEKINTIKQFDKLLSRFLNNSSPEIGKELLKLTWHDLRQRYSKEQESDKDKTRKIGNKEDEENSEMKMNESNNESGGTAGKQKLRTSELSSKSKDFESTVGRIKEKLALLKELVAYTNMKKRQKLKKHFDPYAGFKRGGIH